jgi:WD40 repeat protein/serine/threonine protein kinase
MELVEGLRITEHCDRNKLSTGDRLELFIQVCRAIQHAHQKGIIHRDIKPSNILITQQDGHAVPKVIDFGIAKATQGRLTDVTLVTGIGRFVGTPAYMSPEQSERGTEQAADVDTRTDIYSLGVLLYELLVGRTPFETREFQQVDPNEFWRVIREKEPPRPSTRLSGLSQKEQTAVARRRGTDPPKLAHLVRGDLDWIVMKCLEKERARRYETVNGLAMDVRRYLCHEPVVARPPSSTYRIQKLVRRNKLAFSAAAAILAALVLGLGISVWQAIEKTRAYQRAISAERVSRDEARRADAAASELKRALSASYISQALGLIEKENYLDAMPYLSRALVNDPSNQTALLRLGTLLMYHQWMVTSASVDEELLIANAQFSPDGKQILTVSDPRLYQGSGAGHPVPDSVGRVRETATGRQIGGPFEFPGQVMTAQFSQDGKVVMILSDAGLARIWDAQSARLLSELKQDDPWWWGAQLSPDGHRALTIGKDGIVKIWAAESGSLLWELKREEAVIYAQFSPDGKRVLTGSRGTARIWDARSGQLVRDLERVRGPSSAEFSPSGDRVITGSGYRSSQVWNATNGDLVAEVKHPAAVRRAHFSPDGSQILTDCLDGIVRVWDAETGQPLTDPMDHRAELWIADFSPDGTRVVTAKGNDKIGWLWDVQPGLPRKVSMPNLGWGLATARFSPDGKKVLTASHERQARIWEPVGGEPIVEPLRHAGVVRSVQFSPDGTRVVTASDDGTARVWDSQRGLPLTRPLPAGGVLWSAAQFSPDGMRVVTGSEDGVARVWDVESGELLTERIRHNRSVRSAQFSPDGKRIVTASEDGTARVWDAQSGLPLTQPLQHREVVRMAQFSPDGKRVVSASKDGTARVWDAQTGLPLTEPLKHSAAVRTAEFSPDGTRIVTASLDATARVWDAQAGLPVTAPLKHNAGVWMSAFSRDGKRIITACEDGTGHIWQVEGGLSLGQPLKHRSQVWSAQFSTDGTRVVTASADGTARLWDAESGAPLAEPFVHGGSVLSAQFSPDGKRILTCSRSAAMIWDIPPSGSICPIWLPRLAEAISGQAFNQKGGLEQVKSAELWKQVELELEQSPADDAWTQFGRWLVADPAGRTISPFSKITASDYVERRLKEGALDPLEPALRLARGDKDLWRRTYQAALTVRLAMDLKDQFTEAAVKAKLSEGGVLYQRLKDLAHRLGLHDPGKWLAIEGDPAKLDGYAWLLAVCDDPMARDGANAVTLAERAVALNSRQAAYILDTLGAAYAEAGRFDDAVVVIKEALALPSNSEMKADLTSHLKLFEARIPYHSR